MNYQQFVRYKVLKFGKFGVELIIQDSPSELANCCLLANLNGFKTIDPGILVNLNKAI